MMAIWRRSLSNGRLRIAVALLLVVGASVLFWASQDYAVIAPNWDGQVRGIAYEPSHQFARSEHHWTSPEQIDRDLRQIAQITGRVRTYTVADGLDRVPEIARRYGLTVSIGLWIGPDLEQNEREIETGIRVALANRRVVDRVFVGNEAIMFSYVSADQLNEYIRRVRAALPNRIKVSTAEPWSTWLLNPEIGQYVDFITIHLLPYWEGVPIHGSLDSLRRFYADVQEEFPDKPIVIGESGWPSAGRADRGAEPSLANEAWYI
ncbi:MAG: cellulose synthase, partial [Rhizomicrobium sp.]